MFFLSNLVVKDFMQRRGFNTATLAQQTGLSADFLTDIIEGRGETPDFEPLVKLGKALNCSPFSLIQNHCVC